MNHNVHTFSKLTTNYVAPAVAYSFIDRIGYFLSDQFVDDLAARIAKKLYELEQRDCRQQSWHGTR